MARRKRRAPSRTAWNAFQQDVVECDRCPRLRAHCAEVARTKRRAYADWDYWGRPVPNLGAPPARLLIVGLAPGAHGANRTGRMFTGDRSGDWLFRAMHRAGFANQPQATDRQDGLQLIDCVITAVCHCAPPDNKPAAAEVQACRPFLRQTFDMVQPQVILALGQLAWRGAVDQLMELDWLTGRRPRFGHGARQPLGGARWLIGSYHPSQQNTFTGRLTEAMLDDVFAAARELLELCDS